MLILAASAAAVFFVLERRLSTPRHLVLVVFDTLRADRMSVYGHSKATTPFLERAASEMLRFAEVKAPAPWTIPSHASLLTGLWPSLHRAHWGSMYLADEFQTLGEMLEAEGFCTAAYSANLLVTKRTGMAQGFQSFELVRGPWPEKTAAILEKIPTEVERAASEGCRLFLFLNLMDAHIPYNTERYGGAVGVEGPGPVHNAKIKWEISAGVQPFDEEAKELHGAAYDAAVRYLDDVARDLLELLERQGILDRTLVLFTSDHGDGLGAHPEIGHSISLWEEQLAIPLLVRLPRGRRGGEVVSGRTTLTAVTPTLLDWLGLERPEILRGAPDLEEAAEHPVVADYRSYFSETNRTTNRNMSERYPELAARITHAHVIYCGDLKLIARPDGTFSLFDLEADPSEQIDLASERPRQLGHCRRRYQEALERGFFTPFELEEAGDREEAERRLDLDTLRSLGYVQ